MSLFAQTISHPLKLILRQFYEDVWTNADFSSLSEILGQQYEYHFREEMKTLVPDDLVGTVREWKEAFPDLRCDVEGIVVERNQAAVRVVYRGTQTGEWRGIPAAGRAVEVHKMMFFRFDGERIVEIWEISDEEVWRLKLAEQP